MNVRKFYNGQPGTTIETLHTVPVGEKVILKNILMTNVSLDNATITIHLVPNGGAPDDTNKIIADYNIVSKDTILVEISTVMEESETIQAVQNTANAITLNVSGVEVK